MLGILGPKLRPKPNALGGAGQRSYAPPIEADIKLAVALSLGRGCSYLDMEQWGVEAAATVYEKCFWPVVDAINSTPDFDMSLMPALEAAYAGRCAAAPPHVSLRAPLPPPTMHRIVAQYGASQ